MPRPFSLIKLAQYQQDILGADARRRALLRSALELVKVDPKHALSVFPVYTDDSGGWTEYVLAFPFERGELLYQVDDAERIVVLRRVLWGRRV